MGDAWHDLYKHPLWIKKRAQILKRDNYKCTVCGSVIILHVHHTYYYKGEIQPWAYPNSCLLTLCDSCHNTWHRQNELVYKDKPPQRKRKGKQEPWRIKKEGRTLAEKVQVKKLERDKKKKYAHHKGKWYLM